MWRTFFRLAMLLLLSQVLPFQLNGSPAPLQKKKKAFSPMLSSLVTMVVGSFSSSAIDTVEVSMATRSDVAERILSVSAMPFQTELLLAATRLLPAFRTLCDGEPNQADRTIRNQSKERRTFMFQRDQKKKKTKERMIMYQRKATRNKSQVSSEEDHNNVQSESHSHWTALFSRALDRLEFLVPTGSRAQARISLTFRGFVVSCSV